MGVGTEEGPDLADPEAAPPEIKQVNRDMKCLLQYAASKLSYLLDVQMLPP